MKTRDRVVALLSQAGPEIGLTDLAKALSRPRSEVRDVVRALVSEGIVTRRRPLDSNGKDGKHVIQRIEATP